VVYYLVLCKSLTYAQRTARAIEQAGIRALIIRTPRRISREGCSYCAKISDRRIHEALSILRQYHIPYKHIYALLENGELREVPLA